MKINKTRITGALIICIALSLAAISVPVFRAFDLRMAAAERQAILTLKSKGCTNAGFVVGHAIFHRFSCPDGSVFSFEVKAGV